METSDVSSPLARYYVYILFSFKDKGLYIGFTTDLKSRLQTHAKGKNQATILRRPLKLIHYEYFINKADAKAREEFLKKRSPVSNGTGRPWARAIETIFEESTERIKT